MSKHDHHSCEHEVKYCKKCDVAYCTKCGKEWYVQQYSYYPYGTTYTTGDPTWTITTGSSSGHAH